MVSIKGLLHPTRSLLMEADTLYHKGNERRDWHVGARLLTISALGIACIEASADIALAGVKLALNAACTTFAWALRAVSVTVWVVNALISDQLLNKSLVRWVQFVAFQVFLFIGNRDHWKAQWKLWYDIEYSLLSTGQIAACVASDLRRWTVAHAGLEVISHHFYRAMGLCAFAVGGMHLAANPHQTFQLYGKTVEPWTHPSLLWRTCRFVYKQRRTLAALAGVAAAAALVVRGGTELRKDALTTLESAWTASQRPREIGIRTLSTVWGYTGGLVVRWWNNSPDWNTINAVFRDLKEENNELQKELQDLRNRVQQLEAPKRLFGY